MPVFAQPVASIVEGVQVEWGYSSCSDLESPNTGESCRSLSQELATVKQKNIKSHSRCFSPAWKTGNATRDFSSVSRPCTRQATRGLYHRHQSDGWKCAQPFEAPPAPHSIQPLLPDRPIAEESLGSPRHGRHRNWQSACPDKAPRTNRKAGCPSLSNVPREGARLSRRSLRLSGLFRRAWEAIAYPWRSFRPALIGSWDS